MKKLNKCIFRKSVKIIKGKQLCLNSKSIKGAVKDNDSCSYFKSSP